MPLIVAFISVGLVLKEFAIGTCLDIIWASKFGFVLKPFETVYVAIGFVVILRRLNRPRGEAKMLVSCDSGGTCVTVTCER